MTVNLKRHVSRLFPNELVDRVDRAVCAEELELPAEGGSSSSSILTQIGLSERMHPLPIRIQVHFVVSHLALGFVIVFELCGK